jgi:hypothetical protein
MALGAERRQVLGLVLRKGLALTIAGLVAGIAAVMAGARILSSSLDSPVSAGEPAVLAGAALSLVVIALLASYIPARRATRPAGGSPLRVGSNGCGVFSAPPGLRGDGRKRRPASARAAARLCLLVALATPGRSVQPTLELCRVEAQVYQATNVKEHALANVY